MIILLTKFLETISRKRKIQMIFLLSCMVLSSFLELISIAVFIPFISILLDNKKFQSFYVISNLQDLLGKNFTILFFSLIVFIFIFSGIIRIFTLIWLNRFSAILSNEIVSKAYDVILNEDYESHISQKKSTLINTIHTNGFLVLSDVIGPFMLLIESITFVFLTCIGLMIYDWKIFSIISLILIIIYFLFSKKAKRILKKQGNKINLLNNKSLERLDTDLNSIEYIYLGNLQKFVAENYAKDNKELKISYSKYIITSRLPRIIVEYIALIILILLSLILYLRGNIFNSLPIIATAALLSQKLLPYLQRIYENGAQLINYKEAFSTVINKAIKYKEKNNYNKNFKYLDFNNLEFKNVHFSYGKNPKTLKNISFTIKKGEKVAIMGTSGSGKSTVIRLICGLMKPTSGKIFLNGKELNKSINFSLINNWMRSIGYVPQKINLAGHSLRENIIFGSNPNQNLITIEEVIKICQLDDLVERCNGLDKEILQNSFNLSGGENQRVAIARALYKNPNLLIMDEPTSSLDIETQKKIYDNLLKLKDITCIVITHRIETKYFFDRILKFEGKRLIETH